MRTIMEVGIIDMDLSFKHLLAPMSEDEFFSDYYGKRYVHIRYEDISRDDDLSRSRSSLFGWSDLNEILGMALVWSDKNFHIVLDKEMIGMRDFCRPQLDRNQQSAYVPDEKAVMEWLHKGASLVLDDMDGLSSGSRAIAGILQEAFSAKVQANLYCSWRRRQAFDVHYDTHDVFAVHFAGEKVWNIYETREANPVRHPSYQLGQEALSRRCGAIKEQVCMRAGDILYLPKGQYHDALASDDNALHIAFGVHSYLGLDFVRDLSSSLVSDELFRVPLPLPRDGDGALAEHVKALSEKLAGIAASEELLSQVRLAQEAHRFPHHSFSLPLARDDIGSRPSCGYAVLPGDFKVMERGGKKLLANRGRAVALPDEIAPVVAWVLEVRDFTDIELEKKFFTDNRQKADKFLQDMANMGVIGKS